VIVKRNYLFARGWKGGVFLTADAQELTTEQLKEGYRI